MINPNPQSPAKEKKKDTAIYITKQWETPEMSSENFKLIYFWGPVRIPTVATQNMAAMQKIKDVSRLFPLGTVLSEPITNTECLTQKSPW